MFACLNNILIIDRLDRFIQLLVPVITETTAGFPISKITNGINQDSIYLFIYHYRYVTSLFILP